MPSRHLQVQVYRSESALPAAFDRVFSDPREMLFRSREWLRNLELNGIPPGDRLRLYAVTTLGEGATCALLPAVYSRLYSAHPRARVLHFAGVEGLPYAPLGAPDGVGEAAAESVIRFLCQNRTSFDVLRLGPLVPAAPLLERVKATLRSARVPMHVYRAPSDYFEPTSGRSFADYRDTLPVALRETLDRVWHALVDRDRVSFRLVSREEDLDAAMRDYAIIQHAQIDDPAVERPGYLPGVLRTAARADALRLGILSIDSAPAAAQLWIRSGGIGCCMRMMSVPGRAGLPLDEMVADRVVEHLLDVDGVDELDFGATTDEMARDRGLQTRERVGVIAFNPRTWRGIKGAARHIVAPKLAALPRQVWRRLAGRRP